MISFVVIYRAQLVVVAETCASLNGPLSFTIAYSVTGLSAADPAPQQGILKQTSTEQRAEDDKMVEFIIKSVEAGK